MPAKSPDFPNGALLPGTKYKVVRTIGAGGMGVVYQVEKPPQIQGVLKLMSSDLATAEEFRTRFLDEVRVLAQLDHPNIVKVFDYDTLADGTPFYVMELLHGRTVRDVIATMGTLPPRVAFEVTRQLCEALHCAHTHDIPVIHRDIKPENIFLHAPRHGEPVVKLIDFGVIAVGDRSHDGAFVGTWKYAAPEQIRGERAVPATDLYAVGLVLYEMLCGVGPFDHLDTGPLLSTAHLKDVPPPVSKFAPWVPGSIVSLIEAALAKDPQRRPRDAHVFAERLFELEWANDGKDPNDRTIEGPLSRVLSSVKGAKPSSQGMLAAAPVSAIPIVAIPAAKHHGPTLKGVGEPTSPGEDALLAGLLVRPEPIPQSKKARDSAKRSDAGHAVESPPPEVVVSAASPALSDIATLDADAASRGDARRTVDAAPLGASGAQAPDAAKGTVPNAARGQTYDTDTFSSQESDAGRVAKPRGGKLAVLLAVTCIALLVAAGFIALRKRAAAAAQADTITRPTEPPPPTAPIPAATPPVVVLDLSPPPPPVDAPSAKPVGRPVKTTGGRIPKSDARPAVAEPPSPTPAPSPKPTTAPASSAGKPREDFLRVF